MIYFLIYCLNCISCDCEIRRKKRTSLKMVRKRFGSNLKGVATAKCEMTKVKTYSGIQTRPSEKWNVLTETNFECLSKRTCNS